MHRRFVAQGVVLSDFEDVTSSLKSWDDWCGAWSSRAAVHEKLGREALAAKKHITAAEHLQRAGVYYHFGKFLFVQDLAQMKAAHMKAVECRNLALPYLKPRGERVEMPYEGKWLAGILRKPEGVEKPPVLVFACGLDSCKEETETYENPYLARGIATLVFDGPGQGEGEYDFAGHYNRPDIFHLHINRSAPRLYSVHGEPPALPGEPAPALDRPGGPGGLLEPPAANGGRDDSGSRG